MKSIVKSNFALISLFLFFTIIVINASTIHYAYKKLTCPKCVSGGDYSIILKEERIINPKQRTDELIKNSITKFNNLWHNPIYLDSIPYITHHVYFTPTKKPLEIIHSNTISIATKILTLNKINDKWKHIIWTNNFTIIPPIFKNIENLEIRDISEFKDHKLYQDMATFIYATNFKKHFFSTSSDIARLMALEKFGGLYMDLDYEIYDYKTLVQLLRTNDFVTGILASRGEFFEANNALIASKPNHPILKTALNLIDRNLNATDKPAYIKFPCSRFLSILSTAGPVNFTVAIYNSMQPKTDILLPIRMIYNVDKISPKITLPGELYGVNYLSIPIGDDRFAGSWIIKTDWDECPCLKDFKTEQLKLLQNIDSSTAD